MEQKIDLNDGKYTIIFNDETGELKALRYGKPWREFVGDNLFYWMFVEIRELREKVAQSKT